MSKKNRSETENTAQNSNKAKNTDKSGLADRPVPKPFWAKKQSFLSIFIEIVFIFLVFSIYGAWSVPDENEPNYIAKAMHFWNPDWLANDAFLNSHDTHWLFYQSFGWLSLYCSPLTMAWIGRVTLWLMLAIGWQRLSWAILAVPWASMISSALFAYFISFYNMAGEWVIGGIEGKVFAYVFVLFGLNALVRNRWNWVWIFFGLAAGYHVLVGGWSVVAGGIAWILQKRGVRTGLVRMLPGLVIGAGLSLFGLIPGIMMDRGVSPEIVAKAHEIAVFERLPHHLLPYAIPWSIIARMVILILIWFFCSSLHWKRGTPGNRLVGYVSGTIIISAIGFAIAYGFQSNRQLTADLLRFYWFRMSDFAVPMGVALSAMTLFHHAGRNFLKENWTTSKIAMGKCIGQSTFFVVFLAVFGFWVFSTLPPMISQSLEPSRSLTLSWGLVLLVGAFLAARYIKRPGDENTYQSRIVAVLFYASLLVFSGMLPATINFARQRVVPSTPRTIVDRFYDPWKNICDWIADPENTPEDAKFLVPRRTESFKWYANRSDVGVWKEMPQDSEAMVKWFETMNDCFAKTDVPDGEKWVYSLASVLNTQSPEDIAALQEKYQFDYILAEGWPVVPYLDIVYQTSDNPADRRYILYKLNDSDRTFFPGEPSQYPEMQNLPPMQTLPLSFP